MADALVETKSGTETASDLQVDEFVKSIERNYPLSPQQPLWREQRRQVTTTEYPTGPIDEPHSVISLQLHGQDLILARFRNSYFTGRNNASGTIYLFQLGMGLQSRFLYQAEFTPGQYGETLARIKSGVLEGGPQQLTLSELYKLRAVLLNSKKPLTPIAGQP